MGGPFLVSHRLVALTDIVRHQFVHRFNGGNSCSFGMLAVQRIEQGANQGHDGVRRHLRFAFALEDNFPSLPAPIRIG